MRWRGALVVLLLLTAGLAGCIGGETTDEEVTPTNEGPDGSAAEGSDDRSDDGQAPADPQDEPGADGEGGEQGPVREEITVDAGGTVGTWAFACAPIGCFGNGVPVPADPAVEVAVQGRPVAADVAVIFDRPDGQIKELGVILTQSDPCNGSTCEVLAYGQGTSPIQVSADGLDTDPGRPLRIVVFHPYESVGVVGAQGGVQVDFTVTGTVTDELR